MVVPGVSGAALAVVIRHARLEGLQHFEVRGMQLQRRVEDEARRAPRVLKK